MEGIFHYIAGAACYAFSDSEHATIHARRNAIIQIAIATAAFILMMRVFPAQAVQRHDISRQKGFKVTGDIQSGVFTSADKKLQAVSFAKGHIYKIRLYMQCRINDGGRPCENLRFRLYGSDFSCIYEMAADNNKIRKISKDGYITAQPDIDVEPGMPYYYEIIVSGECENEYRLPVAEREASGQAENGPLYIDGIIDGEACLAADFEYTSPLSASGIAARYALAAAAAVLAYIVAMASVRVYDVRLAQYSGRIGRYARIGAAATSMMASAAVFVFAVVLNKFGGEVWDRLFFAAGIIVLEAWILGAFWRMTHILRTKKRFDMPARARIGLMWRNYIQTASFALLFYSLCQYVNADREFYHYTNTRWMLIFFAVALLMNYNIGYNADRLAFGLGAALLFAAAAGSAIYCNGRFNRDIAANLINGRPAKEWESVALLARLNCGVAAAWGLLLLNIILGVARGGRIDIGMAMHKILSDRLRAAYAGLWVVFCLLMYAYRFEKAWVFTATLPFIAILFTKSRAASSARFLRNFCNGILLSFALVALFCFVHRPHHYWMLYRYGGIFHTVACTGMYLAVVFGAAFAKLYGKLKGRRRMVSYCYAEYFATACVAGFIMLTMSRTAFLTTFVIIIAVAALAGVTYRKGVKRIALELGVLAAVCLVSFPMVFTAVRMIPAVINKPVRYALEYEDRGFMIYEGDPIDSDKYMTVRRFFSTLFGRFREQAGAGTADTGIKMQETGMLAFAGGGLAGLGPRMFQDDADNSGENDEGNDISNGRFKIFKDYIRAIGLKGHPKMGPENEKGEEYSHAHNSYLQVAYNFGMIAGVVFLIVCALALWRSVMIFAEYGKKYTVFMAPFALVVVFGFVSLTEWAFHPCIPAGFCFLFMQMFLMRKVTL